METVPIEAIIIQAENERHRQIAIEHYKKNPVKISSKYIGQPIWRDKHIAGFEKAVDLEQQGSIRKIENEQSKQAGPSLATMAGNFIGAMGAYAKDGFRNVTKDQHGVRQAICNGCEFWDGKARMGAGKCMKCGCSGAKLWMASSECPIKKWGKEEAQLVPPPTEPKPQPTQ